MPKSLPSPELLRKLLRYDPETGELFWLERPIEFFKSYRGMRTWNAKFSGKPAMITVGLNGYKSGALFEKRVYAHRIIWALSHGVSDFGSIDHIDGDKTNNRLSNLREATVQQNSRNQKINSRNTSGVMGVSYITRDKHWQAFIGIDGKTKYLGTFKSKSAAIAARLDAEAKYGFHPNHNRPA